MERGGVSQDGERDEAGGVKKRKFHVHVYRVSGKYYETDVFAVSRKRALSMALRRVNKGDKGELKILRPESRFIGIVY